MQTTKDSITLVAPTPQQPSSDNKGITADRNSSSAAYTRRASIIQDDTESTSLTTCTTNEPYVTPPLTAFNLRESELSKIRAAANLDKEVVLKASNRYTLSNREYMETHILPPLLSILREITKNRPSDPLEVLGQSLLKLHNETFSQSNDGPSEIDTRDMYSDSSKTTDEKSF